VKFVKSEDGIYYFKPRYRTNTSQQVSLVNTVEENRKLYMEEEFMRAKHARRLYHALDTLSRKAFRAII
jgi:hypothetical protein